MSLKGDGFISGKPPMTENESHIFMEYTIVVVVYMIYTMGTSHQDVWRAILAIKKLITRLG